MKPIHPARSFAGAALALLMLPAAPSNAVTLRDGIVETTAPALILSSGCTPKPDKSVTWEGSLPSTSQPFDGGPGRGGVRLCFIKYRFEENDKNFDYYAFAVQAYWTHTEGSANYQAPTNLQITSSIETESSYFGATPSIDGVSCTDPGVSVSASIFGFGISATPRVCSGQVVERVALSAKGALWTSNFAAQLRDVPAVYMQKVKAGKVPRFSVYLSYPSYKNTYRKSCGCWESVQRMRELARTRK